MKNSVLVIVFAVFLGGCSNTVWVKERVNENGKNDTYNQIGGIPFYVKKEVFNQTTSYAQTWLGATLTIEKSLISEKDGKVESFTLDTQSFKKRLLKSQLSDLDTIKSSIMNASVHTIVDVKAIVSSFSKLSSLLDVSIIPPEQIGNTITSTWVVNEEEKYYLNAPMPWFGTGSLTQELNPDGTLAKVVSNPDTKLAEGVSSLIPLKEYLTGKFVDPLKGNSDEEAVANILQLKPESVLVYKVSFSIVETGYVYEFTKTHENAPSTIAPLSFDTANQTYTRSALGEKPSSGNKKEEGKSVGLTGIVNFPKDW